MTSMSMQLAIGKHAQVVEIECQREYEGKGAYPNYSISCSKSIICLLDGKLTHHASTLLIITKHQWGLTSKYIIALKSKAGSSQVYTIIQLENLAVLHWQPPKLKSFKISHNYIIVQTYHNPVYTNPLNLNPCTNIFAMAILAPIAKFNSTNISS